MHLFLAVAAGLVHLTQGNFGLEPLALSPAEVMRKLLKRPVVSETGAVVDSPLSELATEIVEMIAYSTERVPLTLDEIDVLERRTPRTAEVSCVALVALAAGGGVHEHAAFMHRKCREYATEAKSTVAERLVDVVFFHHHYYAGMAKDAVHLLPPRDLDLSDSGELGALTWGSIDRARLRAGILYWSWATSMAHPEYWKSSLVESAKQTLCAAYAKKEEITHYPFAANCTLAWKVPSWV